MSEDREELPDLLDAERARLAVARDEVAVVDIRDPDEFAADRINSAVRMDADAVGGELGERSDDKPVLIVCSDGERSAEIAEGLRKDGVRAVSIEGGFETWTSEGSPTAPRRDEEYEGPDVKIPGAVSSSGGGEDEDEDEEGSDGG